MKLFKNILVVQAADQPATASLRTAVHFAQQTGCAVKVVDIQRDDHTWWQDIFSEHARSLDIDAAEQQDCLNALVDEADFPDDVRVKVLKGRPIDALVREVESGQHDLLLKDANSESESLFFGSLDMRLMRMCRVPIWISNVTSPPKTRRILAAIDPQAKQNGKRMNERVIRAASLLARQEMAELFIISVWHTPSGSFESGGNEMERSSQFATNVKRHAWENVEHAVAASLLKIPTDNVLFEKSIGSNAIVSAVRDVQPDLLVMGSIAHTGIPGLLIGNTAEEVVRQIECSVLMLKPENFDFLLPHQSNILRTRDGQASEIKTKPV